jgi:aryl-alcohol dehydrogenase-like predicted oxidoreductase
LNSFQFFSSNFPKKSPAVGNAGKNKVMTRIKEETHIKANWEMIHALTDFGNPRGLTPAQVALAWLMAQKPWIVPIPGTTKLAHLNENILSADFQFTADELKKFNDTVNNISITGKRTNKDQINYA